MWHFELRLDLSCWEREGVRGHPEDGGDATVCLESRPRPDGSPHHLARLGWRAGVHTASRGLPSGPVLAAMAPAVLASLRGDGAILWRPHSHDVMT